MTDIKSMTIDELKKLMTTLGDKPFRAKQIYSWLHEHLVTSYGCGACQDGTPESTENPSGQYRKAP